MHELFKQHADNVQIVVASRYEETQLFTVTKSTDASPEAIKQISFIQENIQMTLFG